MTPPTAGGRWDRSLTVVWVVAWLIAFILFTHYLIERMWT